MYQRILVATGGSPWSTAAVRYAAVLAARAGAELRILTVLTPLEESGPADRPASVEPVLSSLEQQTQALLTQAATHATRARVVSTTHAARGSIPATIQQTAVEEACDLIIMGARQVVGTQRRTLGGIVNAVAAQATQPVMVIKTASALDHPLGRPLLVATGGSRWSEVAVEHALQLDQGLQLKLCVIHVEAGPRQPGNTPRPAAGSPVLASVITRAEALGVRSQHIVDISARCSQHIVDIGHPVPRATPES